jgi:hypothetical protein
MLAVELREARLRWFHDRFLRAADESEPLNHLCISAEAALHMVGTEFDASDPHYPVGIDLSFRHAPGGIVQNAQVSSSPIFGGQIGWPRLLRFGGAYWYGCFYSTSSDPARAEHAVTVFQGLAEQLRDELYQRKGIRDLQERWLEVLYETFPQGRCHSSRRPECDSYPIAWLPWDVFLTSARAIGALANTASQSQVSPKSQPIDAVENSGPETPIATERLRPAYERDHLWLRWQEEQGVGPADIRDLWDAMPDSERRKVCPRQWQRVGGDTPAQKKAGRETVKQGLKRAKADRKKERGS